MKVYLASSVWIDYVDFARKCIDHNPNIDVVPIYFYDEFTYRKFARGTKIEKFLMRIGMYLGYPLLLLWRLLRSENGSICIITSNTFYAPAIGLALRFIKKLTIIQFIYDLFPDAMISVQRESLAKKILPALQSLATWQLTSSPATIFLGEHLRNYAEYKYAMSPISIVMDMGADEKLHKPRDVTIARGEKIHLHYGGQFGRFHDLYTLMEGIKACRHIADVEFSFAISGVKVSEVEMMLKGVSNCQVGPAIPSHKWRESTSNFHVGIVTLTREGMNVCLPSKTYSLMAASMAIIAVCPKNSDLAHVVQANNCGWVIDVGDIEGFVSIVEEISLNRQTVAGYRSNARTAAVEKYGLKPTARRWHELLSGIVRVQTSRES